MSWVLLFGLVIALGILLFSALLRGAELKRMQTKVRERERAVRSGSAEAQLQHPVIDLTRCLGCGACVRACPEDGVLALLHGQAQVVNGARCQGHAACERECPTAAITVTLTNLAERRDIPVVDENLEAIGTPGLFLAGEVTAHALIKSAIEQGTSVARSVAGRLALTPERNTQVLDLCIVGAGPAGLACSLEAKLNGLTFVTLDQEPGPGGTVARYPRRKLVVLQPVQLPVHGKLAELSYSKEELMALWTRIAREQALPLRCNEVFQGVERQPDGTFHVRTQTGIYHARCVCLAIGRRGTPRKLEVPGENLAKVAYSLMDAASYQGRRILVVGGGDSAVEAALALADQPGNAVTLSYRQEAFFRIKARNEELIQAAIADGRVHVLFSSRVLAILPDAVELEVPHITFGGTARGSQQHATSPLALATATRTERLVLPNDEVFAMAGGVAPFELLERSGVSFDPALRPAAEPLAERGNGIVRALAVGFALALATLGFALWHSDYYMLPLEARPVSDKHVELRPALGTGLWLGISAALLIGVNLVYLLRRSQKLGFSFGSLRAWMTSHVATGILALLLALLHSGMAPRDTVGGHALLALAVLLVTGAVGRYFYAYVPRAANGRELKLAEVRRNLESIAAQWDSGQKAYVESVRAELAQLVESRQWSGTLLGRIVALFAGQRDLHKLLARLAERGHAAGIPTERVRDTLRLAREAHRMALMAAHYEDLRALLNSWRYVHRWVAALMILLLVLHVVFALTYSASFDLGRAP